MDSYTKRDIIKSILCLTASVLLFAWHMHAFRIGQHILHIILFYPVNIGFLFGALYGCKALDGIKFSFVTNLSIGTLVIIGLHIVFITVVNYTFEYLFGMNETICYQWYEALATAFFIVALLYPMILVAKIYAPIFLGKKIT